MKKALLTMAVVLLAIVAPAQIKVHDDGQISLGSLDKTYGVQVRSDGYTTFRTQYSTSGSWATLSYSRHNYQKHWIVANLADTNNPGLHTFFVQGNGHIYSRGNWIDSDSNDQSDCLNIENAGNTLDSIHGFSYTPTEEISESKSGTHRQIGGSAQELEKVLPEAVASDESGVLYVDYKALTAYLIEAVKEQRREMKLMRKTLEEHGLLEPEKH